MPNWTDDEGRSHFDCRRPNCCGNDEHGNKPVEDDRGVTDAELVEALKNIGV